MHVVSVRIGAGGEIDLGSKTERSGIVKEPVERAVVTAEGLDGDTIVSTVHHGGPDQAVYLYGADDYAWWEMPEGLFGENVTLSTLGPDVPRIGDRYQIGEVVLEVTSPRVPCAKLAARVGDPGFVKRFNEAKRPGAYARVISGGELTSGADVALLSTTDEHPTILEIQDLFHERRPPEDVLVRALAAPVAIRARADLERKLERVRSEA